MWCFLQVLHKARGVALVGLCDGVGILMNGGLLVHGTLVHHGGGNECGLAEQDATGKHKASQWFEQETATKELCTLPPDYLHTADLKTGTCKCGKAPE